MPDRADDAAVTEGTVADAPVADAIVRVRGATVRYPSGIALDGVSLTLRAGEVHSLMGENGAGKSTLVKAITGALRLDDGTIELAGADGGPAVPVRFSSPRDAQLAGIHTVYQEIDLLPNLTVAENIALGREPRRFGAIDWAGMRAMASTALAELGLDIDPSSLLGSQPLAVQQLVAIARATSADVRVLILDEPTSSLDLDEVAELFRVIRDLKQRGVAIVFISHFLDQVYEICDRITVLRGGRLVGEYATQELLRIDLVQKMLGREVADLVGRDRAESTAVPTANPVLSGRGITVGRRLVDADVDLIEGEVLGAAGLLGSGRTELARVLTGADSIDSGVLRLRGSTVKLRSPRQAIDLGAVYSSENRRTEGIVGELSVRENIALALQAQRGVLRRISTARQQELAASWIETLDIRPADPEHPAGTLSGGNQQKVLLARLLALSPRVLVLDEPTRGIDVGTKVQIQNLVGDMAENGIAVLFISAELEEVLRVGHRVAILRDGRIIATLASDDLNIDALLAMVAKPDDDDEIESTTASDGAAT